MRSSVFAALMVVAASATPLLGQSNTAPAAGGCGAVVTIETHDGTRTRYALAHPQASGRMAVVLLAGGGGFLDLDDQGCPRALKGNSLVRSLPHFHRGGFATALVDAPSDHRNADGLAGFRITPQHADDVGKVIADMRKRSNVPVWLIGTSRGTISAVNAAARLAGPSAPDGLVLTSAVTSGGKGGQKPWVVQTVFGVPLEAIRVPVLVVGHAADTCLRTPPELMSQITARTNGAGEQVVTVAGGPGGSAGRGGNRPSVEACAGSTPHGFVQQEAAVTRRHRAVHPGRELSAETASAPGIAPTAADRNGGKDL
jgi:hypothetical protein